MKKEGSRNGLGRRLSGALCRQIRRIPVSAASRLLVVALGIVVGQAILYGPSLIGVRVLLPLDVLAEPYVYLPRTPDMPKNVLHDAMQTDLVFYYEPARQFAISELRDGRLPFWSPSEFGGVGCFRWNLSPLGCWGT